MALNIRLKLCPNGCAYQDLFDITDVYDATTNTGGYNGGSNPSVSDLDITAITITDPNAVVYSVPSFPANPGYPAPFLLASIDASNFGGTAGDAMPDGIYTVVYEITNNGIVGDPNYVITCQFLITCQAKNCLDEKLKEIKSVDCGCDNNDIDQLYAAYLLLIGAEKSALCGKIIDAQNKLEQIQNFCGQTVCDTCD